jgi:hypothetical protein
MPADAIDARLTDWTIPGTPPSGSATCGMPSTLSSQGAPPAISSPEAPDIAASMTIQRVTVSVPARAGETVVPTDMGPPFVCIAVHVVAARSSPQLRVR